MALLLGWDEALTTLILGRSGIWIWCSEVMLGCFRAAKDCFSIEGNGGWNRMEWMYTFGENNKKPDGPNSLCSVKFHCFV